MAVTASFIPSTGLLTVFGDALDNNITISRDAAGQILVNGGAVTVQGGTPTVANVALIQAFGQGGADQIVLDERNGALPAANLFGGEGDDTLIVIDAGLLGTVTLQNINLASFQPADFLFV